MYNSKGSDTVSSISTLESSLCAVEPPKKGRFRDTLLSLEESHVSSRGAMLYSTRCAREADHLVMG